MGLRPRWSPALLAYQVAVAASVAAALLRLALHALLGDQAPFFPFLLAVLVSAWYGGLVPGMVATVLGAIFGAYLFTLPFDFRQVLTTNLAVRTGLFFVLGLAASSLCGGLHAARRRLEEKQKHLTQTEQRVGAVVNHVIDGIITIDEDGVVQSVNLAVEKLFGYGASEIIGRNIRVLMPREYQAEDEQTLVSYFRSSDAKGSDVGREVIGRRKDGSTFLMDLAVSEFQDEDHRYSTGIVRDITERKRIEHALRRERELLQTILDRIPVMLTVYEPDARVLRLNPHFEKVIGWSVRETAGISLMEECYPDRAYREQVRRFMDSCDNGWMDICMRTRSGASVETSWANVRLSDQTQLGIGIEITERKRAEETLRRNEARMRLLWEAAETLLHADDPNAMLRSVFAKIAPHLQLDAYLNFLVEEKGDALRLASSEGIPAEIAQRIARLEFGQPVCGAVAIQREPMVASFSGLATDSAAEMIKSLGFRVHACNPLMAGDAFLGTLSFASRSRDTFEPAELEFLQTISQYVTIAYERLRLIQQLREADRRKDEFLATLAHELRNPLAPIRNALQLWSMAEGDADQVAQARSIMERQFEQMVHLVDDLLDISRITRGKLELRMQHVSLEAIVRNAVETAQPVITASAHELAVVLPPEPIYLEGDAVRLAQVFSNLLNNAAKYTERGGRIWLTAERQGEAVVVSVRDTGIGISEKNIPNLFKMFSQVEPGLGRSQGGLGIGLSLVRGIVEMHGGTIDALSAGPEQGSEFIVRLPVAAEATQRPSGSQGNSKHRGPSRRILVVDDNRDAADSLSSFLQMLGHEPRTSYDGAEALEAAEMFRPEIVLLDIGLPKMNGYEVARKLRENSWGRDLILIALTGWGMEEDRKRAFEAGFDHHLTKPADLEVLRKLLTLPASESHLHHRSHI
jgi:PAS domain S-box-containing protein